MNPRIQEFCIEATTYTQIWAAGLGEVTPLEWKDTYNKKFAELIVLGVLDKVGQRWSEGDIKQHFGVTQ